MTIYDSFIISLGILAVLGFIVLALNYWVSMFWGVGSNHQLLCPYCGQRAGEKSGDEFIGRFQKTERRYTLHGWERSPGKIIWYEKYKIHYTCKHCRREWESFAVMKQ